MPPQPSMATAYLVAAGRAPGRGCTASSSATLQAFAGCGMGARLAAGGSPRCCAASTLRGGVQLPSMWPTPTQRSAPPARGGGCSVRGACGTSGDAHRRGRIGWQRRTMVPKEAGATRDECARPCAPCARVSATAAAEASPMCMRSLFTRRSHRPPRSGVRRDAFAARKGSRFGRACTWPCADVSDPSATWSHSRHSVSARWRDSSAASASPPYSRAHSTRARPTWLGCSPASSLGPEPHATRGWCSASSPNLSRGNSGARLRCGSRAPSTARLRSCLRLQRAIASSCVRMLSAAGSAPALMWRQNAPATLQAPTCW